MKNDLKNICICISGNRRNKILYRLSKYVTINNIFAHRCFIDSNFIEKITYVNDTWYNINSARYEKYYDLKRYTFDKFIKCTKNVFPIYVIITPNELLLTYIKLKGLILNKSNIGKALCELNLDNLIYKTKIEYSLFYVYSDFEINNTCYKSILDYDCLPKLKQLINKESINV